MEKNEKISTPLVLQVNLEGKQNFLEEKLDNIGLCKSSSFSVSKKKLLLESDENILNQKQVQIESEQSVTSEQKHYELNLTNPTNTFCIVKSMQQKEGKTEKENFPKQGPVEISYKLQPQVKLEKQDGLLKRAHSPVQFGSPSLPKKPLLLDEDINIQNEKHTQNECKPNMGGLQEEHGNLTFERPTNAFKSANHGYNKSRTERESFSLSEEELFKDNLKLDKEKVKRRRSSFGRCLSRHCSDTASQTSDILISESTVVSGTGADVVLRQADTVRLESGKVLKKDVIQDKSLQQRKEDLLIKKYNEMSRKLTSEYEGWKKLRHIRKQRVFEAQRELMEAKKSETLIEEDHILPHLSKEQKAILLSRPSYEKYLEEVKLAMECLVLTQQEVEKVSLTYRSFVKGFKSRSRRYYELIEDYILGELKEKDPKLLLKSLIKYENSVT